MYTTIGHTQLVTMDIDMGESPLIVQCVKTINPFPQTLQLGSTRNRDIGMGWSHQNVHQPLGQSYCCPQEICPW